MSLAAQGLGQARPVNPGRRHVLGAIKRSGALQIDSVNVLVRAHYMPGFTRLGAYPRALLDGLAWGKPHQRALFEYWGHEASMMPFAMQPLFRWRMAKALRGVGMWTDVASFAVANRDKVAAALSAIRDQGAMAAADLGQRDKDRKGFWSWSDGKKALEFLVWSGQLAVAGRRGNFERLYDLPERVLPADVLAAPTPAEADAHRALVALAARALGIGRRRISAGIFAWAPTRARASPNSSRRASSFPSRWPAGAPCVPAP